MKNRAIAYLIFITFLLIFQLPEGLLNAQEDPEPICEEELLIGYIIYGGELNLIAFNRPEAVRTEELGIYLLRLYWLDEKQTLYGLNFIGDQATEIYEVSLWSVYSPDFSFVSRLNQRECISPGRDFSPDGNLYATCIDFNTTDDKTSFLAIYSLETERLHLLLEDTSPTMFAEFQSINFSPQGTRIAYLNPTMEDYTNILRFESLYVMDLACIGKPRCIEQAIDITHLADDYKPAFDWSPDGESVAITCHNTQLCILNLEGEVIEQHIPANANINADDSIANIQWSPCGNLIMYQVSGSVFTFDLDTGEEKQILDWAEDPIWILREN